MFIQTMWHSRAEHVKAVSHCVVLDNMTILSNTEDVYAEDGMKKVLLEASFGHLRIVMVRLNL